MQECDCFDEPVRQEKANKKTYLVLGVPQIQSGQKGSQMISGNASITTSIAGVEKIGDGETIALHVCIQEQKKLHNQANMRANKHGAYTTVEKQKHVWRLYMHGQERTSEKKARTSTVEDVSVISQGGCLHELMRCLIILQIETQSTSHVQV